MLINLLVLLIVAGLCGAAGNALAGGNRNGCFLSIALGFVGALLGTWLARAAGLPDLFTLHLAGTAIPIVWSIVGSAIFVAIITLLTRKRP
jgi:uncharacterized membrane protein YeaQ/YmgE (transglycosylase-associated protein family)